MILHMLRHGETVVDGRLLGRSDPDVSAEGLKIGQAQLATLQADAVITSPMKRAAQIAGREAPEDARWAEMDFGDWDGQQLDKLDGLTRGAFGRFLDDPESEVPPNGESWPAFRLRVADAIDDIIAIDDVASVAVVTHAGVIRTALHIACNLPFPNTWALHIGYGTAVTLRLGRSGAGVWGEIIALRQP